MLHVLSIDFKYNLYIKILLVIYNYDIYLQVFEFTIIF